MWDRKFGREVYDVFSSFVDLSYEEFVGFTTSILPGLSEEFMVDYIRELGLEGNYSNIVWDTAPLGQTLALLHTPAMLVEHLKMAPRIYSRLKLGSISREPILNIISRWKKLSAEEMDFLRNDVDFVIVTIAEALAVEQLEGVFSEGQRVKVTGTTKGKGFAGAMKRHGFHGGKASHGSKVHRAPQSTGATQANRVFPGTRKPGHLGNTRCTVKGLRVVRVDAERHLLLLRGAVPGPNGGTVIVTPQ